MKLDPDLIHYLTKEHFRVLTAVEMGMKNHEYVPVPLIESIADLKRSNTYKIIQFLLKHKLVMHVNKVYSGYALTYMGYDYLALKAFMKRGTIRRVGIKIGVGKESDIYLCEGAIPKKEGEQHDEEEKGELVVIKFARLGRTSFRTVKNNRDYLKGRVAQSWLYMSRIASLKEFAFMKALYNKNFPTPVPIDSNRHGIVMSYIRAYPMSQVREMQNPKKVYGQLLDQLIRLAEHGLVHGDFNEFNLLIDEDENITIIDFPQMTSTNHPQAQFYFERDVRCVQDFFNKKFGLLFEGIPILETHEHYLDKDQNEEESSEEEDNEENEVIPELVQIPDEETKDLDVKSESDSEDDEQEQPERTAEEIKKFQEERKKLKLEKQQKKLKEKLIINDEYVKEKAKQQFNNKTRKQQAKRNKNKDKKVMKDNETIKDYFLD